MQWKQWDLTFESWLENEDSFFFFLNILYSNYMYTISWNQDN